MTYALCFLTPSLKFPCKLICQTIATMKNVRLFNFSMLRLLITLVFTAKWELYYSARVAYGSAVAKMFPGDPLLSSSAASSTSTPSYPYPSERPLDAAFWHRLTEVFMQDNSTFLEFVDRRTRGARKVRRVSEEIRNRTICDLRAMRSENSCVSPISSLLH